jgi:hypothetical protein
MDHLYRQIVSLYEQVASLRTTAHGHTAAGAENLRLDGLNILRSQKRDLRFCRRPGDHQWLYMHHVSARQLLQPQGPRRLHDAVVTARLSRHLA